MKFKEIEKPKIKLRLIKERNDGVVKERFFRDYKNREYMWQKFGHENGRWYIALLTRIQKTLERDAR